MPSLLAPTEHRVTADSYRCRAGGLRNRATSKHTQIFDLTDGATTRLDGYNPSASLSPPFWIAEYFLPFLDNIGALGTSRRI